MHSSGNAEEIPIEANNSMEKTSSLSGMRAYLQECLDGLVEQQSSNTVEISAIYEKSLPEKLRAFSYETGMRLRMFATDRYATKVLRNSCPEGIAFEKNENLKTASQILDAGIDSYLDSNSDAKVFWPTDGDIVEVSDLFDILGTSVGSGDISSASESFAPEVQESIEIGLKNNHPRAAILLKDVRAFYDSDARDTTYSGISIEDLDPHNPLCLSDFIERNLAITDGDIREALYLSAIDLKFLTRHSFENVYNEEDADDREIAATLKKGLLDELSVFTPFSNLPELQPKDKSSDTGDIL